MMFDSLGFSPASPQSGYLQAMMIRVLQNPLFGVNVEHYKAELVDDPATFDKQGNPDYLAADAGKFESGIKYLPNPQNPLRGVYCRAPWRPNLEQGGFIYQAEFDLYLSSDPGNVFVLEGSRPKRQDRFDIQGSRFYATAPAMPCQMGEVVAMWKLTISRERYPVRLESDGICSEEQGWEPWLGV